MVRVSVAPERSEQTTTTTVGRFGKEGRLLLLAVSPPVPTDVEAGLGALTKKDACGAEGSGGGAGCRHGEAGCRHAYYELLPGLVSVPPKIVLRVEHRTRIKYLSVEMAHFYGLPKISRRTIGSLYCFPRRRHYRLQRQDQLRITTPCQRQAWGRD